MKKYDAIIIGFGKGGKTLAAELAKRNFTVAMIERSDKMYGGTCINIGCIPTKTLVHSAELADKSASWEQKQAYYRRSVAKKEEVTSFLRQKNYRNLADHPNITVYTGTGSFIAPDAVEVRMAEETIRLQAPRIFVNTGAERNTQRRKSAWGDHHWRSNAVWKYAGRCKAVSSATDRMR